MADATELDAVGSVVSLWRYPVKSMMGEELNATDVTERGLLGDRVYALVDGADGKVATAKNPRKWPRLFDFRAAFVDPPDGRGMYPPVRITMPDGTTAASPQDDLDLILSKATNRNVKLSAADHGPGTSAEAYWPDIQGLDHRDTVTDFTLPEQAFFDCATIHLLTTATIDHLRELHPKGRFEVRRFRPNIVVEPGAGMSGFVESGWIGRTLRIGTQVQLKVTGPCSRCVMTTLPQGDLPEDRSILRAIVEHGQGIVGVYASVARGGAIHRGDRVELG